jgi:hypothetical protein
LGSVVEGAGMAALMDRVGMKRPGASLGEFSLRIDILGEICRQLLKVQPASLVHWTQSNMLIAGELFTALLDRKHPSMLTVHPKLFSGPPLPGFEETPAGLLTLGAADYIGRGIYVAPAPIPWFELYEIALSFMRVALVPGGYVVPDDETFGPESKAFSCLVRHLEAAAHPMGMREPAYALTLRHSAKHGYTTMEHETRSRVPDGMPEVAAEIDRDEDRQQDLIADWRRKEQAARAIGGSLELYRRGISEDDDPSPDPSPRFGGGFGRRTAVFGRKH